MDFYQLIKERRALLGLTQQDLADYTGLSPRIIKSIETGKANPSIGTLGKIDDTLGLELIMEAKEIKVRDKRRFTRTESSPDD